MLNENDVKKAMDARLSGLEASSARRARIRKRIADEEERPIMKRKLTIGLALAIAMLLALSGVALAVGLNLFDYFSSNDQRYAELADQAMLTTEIPTTVDSDQLGAVSAAINSAYYDGQSLSVAYVIQNASYSEPWTPTQEELDGMTQIDPPPTVALDENSDSIMAEYNDAVQSGTPYGYVQYSVYASDHTTMADGTELPPSSAMSDQTENGDYYELIEYEMPLPAQAQDQDAIELHIALYQSTLRIYFDGETCYMSSERQEAGEMVATVSRSSGETRRLTGSGTVDGHPVTVEAIVSAMRASVTVTADEEIFLPITHTMDDGSSWQENPWCMFLYDEQGKALLADGSASPEAAQQLTISFTGTGGLPETLELYVLSDPMDAPVDARKVMEEMEAIKLTVTQ